MIGRCLIAFALLVGCHKEHTVSVRVEGTGICLPDIISSTVINGKADVQRTRQTLPWEHELAPGLSELSIEVASPDPSCTKVQCQITVDGAVVSTKADVKDTTCAWKP